MRLAFSVLQMFYDPGFLHSLTKYVSRWTVHRIHKESGTSLMIVIVCHRVKVYAGLYKK